MTVSETSLTSSSCSAKSHATLPPDLPSAAHAPDECATLPPSSPLPLEEWPRRGSNFLLGRASVVGTGLSKSDPSFDFFEEGARAGGDGGGAHDLAPEEVAAVAAAAAAAAVFSPSATSAAGRRRKQSAWKKKLGEPGVALQARIVRDKALHVGLLTERLRVLTEELADGNEEGEEEEDRSGEKGERQFVDINLRIREEINDIFNHVQVSLDRNSVTCTV